MKRQDGYLTKKSGAWMGHYSRWITNALTGERTRQQKAFKIGPVSQMTKTEAKNKLRERLVSDLGITEDSRVTLGWFLENRWKPMHEGTWRDSTKAVNNELLKFIVDRFGSTPLEDMDSVAMQSWLNELAKKKSGSLVMHCRIFLRSILAEATEQDYLRKNPARLLRVPKLKAVKKPFLSVQEVTALLKAAEWSRRDYTLLTVMLVTGFRPSELFALKWSCFDSQNRTLTIAETIYRGKVRLYTKTTEEGEQDRLTVYLPEPAMNALGSWYGQAGKWEGNDYTPPDEDSHIFPNADGGFLHKENYQRRVLAPLAKMAGIPRLNFQVLRRTVATHAQAYGSPKDIATVLRHKKVQVAQDHYIQAVTETVRRAVDKLGDALLPERKM